eukprot:CAMPEP_0181196446 /NCGR_PEP_ID=MMETSP1096-20121128/15472_1 /TAXON_ID=156174 ORGANISM="Chrysochromulina ericina, Strain CCMP281" /NCGR_SAMPLE_ID=MMETSP1096 /ASSEMBLY_ACC=CAM_ASM_000453 /LENGTH=418 /DNA_ID=CAMNT_0023286211 /DNA_START=27 /DNA_END=1283 /DNA_ORIENTATION=+
MTDNTWFKLRYRRGSYERQPYFFSIETVKMLFRTEGSVVFRLLFSAVPAGLAAGLLATAWRNFIEVDGKVVMNHPYAHQIFSLTIGYMLTIRCQQAYNRWWEACHQVRSMWSKLDDVAMQCAAFDESEATPVFTPQLVHMCSLLSALMVQHLQQQEDLSSLVATRIGKAALLKSLGQSRSSSRSSHGPKGSGQTSDAVAAPSSPTVVQDSIEVLGGLTPEEREVLEGSQEHVHHTLSWVVRMITKRQAGGGLKVPPPILSRVYQELSNAYLAFNGAAKIAATPFPFPYAQVAVVQILVLMITIPIIVATFCADAPIFASGLTAVTVGGFHAIVEISYELEAPFSAHANAIPLKLMHDQFNRQLESLLQPTFIDTKSWMVMPGSGESVAEGSTSGDASQAAAQGKVSIVHFTACSSCEA